MAILNTGYSFKKIHSIFKSAKRIFFIGIGGVSMSALARYCVYMGKEVFGYDRVRSKESARLESICSIKYYSTPDNVCGMDMVIYTGAIDGDNFEYKRAMELEIPTLSRANFLGYVVSRYEGRIGVAGMHGKSTTTAMLSSVFTYAGKSPTVFCGASMQGVETTGIIGVGGDCIFEACEYTNSFHSLPVKDAVILNIDYDHPDFFKSMEQIKESFQRYIRDAERVFINADDENSSQLYHKNIITYGLKNGTYRAKIIHSTDKTEGNTGKTFALMKGDEELCVCSLRLGGEHMVYDALCALAVSLENGIEPKTACEALSAFEGTGRRMEKIGKTPKGVAVFEDYAHHPREIECTLGELKRQYGTVMCVFQPHTYSRTHFLYGGFVESLSLADELIITETYSAREENVYGVSEKALATDAGGIFLPDMCAISKQIKESDCGVIVIMGAGDIYRLRKYL